MFPKKIWRYWAQGWENAPFAVKYCSQSVAHYASDWEIIDIDSNNLKKYIDLPSKINEIHNFPIQITSDMIRILLLKEYGGVWIDATVFLNMNFTEFMAPLYGDFFCFWRWPNKATMSNWFLAADRDSYIAKTFSKHFIETILSNQFLQENLKYFNRWKGSPNYYCFHNLFEKFCQKDKKFNAIIQNMPFIDSTPLIKDVFNGWNKEVVHETESALSTTPLFKLSHSVTKENYNENSILDRLIRKMNSSYTPPEKHLHTTFGLRTFQIYNSFIERPEKVKNFAGPLESEADLKLCADKASRYHVYNFSSQDLKNGAQLLIPYGSSRIFFRYQQSDKFSQARELAYRDEIESLRKEVYELFWDNIFDRIIDIIPPEITPSPIFNKHYIQFFIDGIDKAIHYELIYKNATIYLCIHCENEILSNKYREKFIYLSKILEEDIIEKKGMIYINKKINKLSLRSIFTNFLKNTYNQICSMKS